MLMLYKGRNDTVLKKEHFQNPGNEYRGAPFWAWNCKVGKKDADCILNELKEMGMGGAHIHCRTGLDLPYLSPEFMDMVRYSHEKGNQLGMLTWLYDEDRFPSGGAGGLVTKNWDYRQRFLVLSPDPIAQQNITHGLSFLGSYLIGLNHGCLKMHQFFKPGEPIPENSGDADVWYLYREIAGDNPWFNNQAYVDTLNPKAIDKFVETTYEAYYREFGEEFGKTIPGIFTDEPQFCHKSTLGFADEKRKIVLPFTDDLPDTYREACQFDFFEVLPECIWELPGGEISPKRYYFHNHICDRFVHAFADNIGGWCKKHGIALTGHMMEEPTLASQTAVLGEAMRSYRSFELPGIDMLYDGRELNTAKQAQSAVHQFGKEGMLSELYGVTDWDFDFRGHKLAGDWQAALGVTIRVHHLTWTSMAGEAKRDYPASIGYQSPWYQEYHLVEDYFARLNTAMTRGRCEIRIAVIHPIESYWLYWGPREQTQGIRDELESNFKNLTEWLLFGFMDFDFIAESLWEELTPDRVLSGEERFKVGRMMYDCIVVPGIVTIRQSTLRRLKAFKEQGGRVIFAGTIPSLVDAVPCDDAAVFAKSCEHIGFTSCCILEVLEPFRMVDVHNQQGVRVNNMLSQVRIDGDGKWLFLAHCRRMPNPDLPVREELSIKIAGTYQPVSYDAMTGEIRDVPCGHMNGWTVINETVYDHDSLLYYLKPAPDMEAVSGEAAGKELLSHQTAIMLPDFADFRLEEPNVLILDMPEYRLDDGLWQPREEILRIDNKFRTILGYPLRTEAFPQPWTARADEGPKHRVVLRFAIQADTDVDSPLLALEHAEEVTITLNHEKVPSSVTGYYTDRSIETVLLPGLKRGTNILEAEMPYCHRFHLEAMYLLGAFGVRVAGKHAAVTGKSHKIAFGDICSQGLPFYGGNLTYQVPVHTDLFCCLKIEITQFRAPLIQVSLDGADRGRIAFSPYCLIIEGVSAGDHTLELKVFGSRINTFGALHNCNHTRAWPGHPDSYRTKGPAWSYEYQIRPAGILVSPVITCIEINK